MDSDRIHRYHASCSWTGSTGGGYRAYDRSHAVSVLPAGVALALSADPAFLGDPAKANPEQLLLVAAASCQLLSFLAVAARARIDIVAYTDQAEALMPEAPRPARIAVIHLRPEITVLAPASEERVRELVAVAHRECFIANSLSCAMEIDPVVNIRSRREQGLPSDGPRHRR